MSALPIAGDQATSSAPESLVSREDWKRRIADARKRDEQARRLIRNIHFSVAMFGNVVQLLNQSNYDAQNRECLGIEGTQSNHDACRQHAFANRI